MEFIIYDIILLIIFAIFVSLFLYSRKKNLKREGLLLLYKTSWGIKLINYVGKKYKRTLKFLSYISILLGYFLMITMVYLFTRIIWIYLFSPDIVRAIKIPPIMPLIPYLPQVFKLDFLPPFYFIYWIIIIAIIAIPHEFAHGIFSAYNKIKIKNTGFGFFPYFLPVFLAAFVEPDEKEMVRQSKFKQMSILSAGTFANILTAIFFFVILWFFFSVSFAPVGVVFDSYAHSVVNVSAISMVNGVIIKNITYNNTLNLIDGPINEIKVNDKKFLVSKELFEDNRNKELFEKQGIVVLYDDSPAFRSGLMGAISEVDGIKIDSKDKLGEEILKHSPGDNITLKVFTEEEYKNYEITLGESPGKKDIAWLGIGFIDRSRGGVLNRVINFMSSFKKPHVYYESRFGLSEFIYNLLWWIILISISVALVNMLPIGIFDGGRFFYLTIAAITGSERVAKKAFVYLTYLFLLLLALIMVFWAGSFL